MDNDPSMPVNYCLQLSEMDLWSCNTWTQVNSNCEQQIEGVFIKVGPVIFHADKLD